MDLAERSPQFDLLDLFLMNHFTSVTSLGLFGGEKHRDLWQKEVPTTARLSPMLMHGLLSVSALHLAHIASADMEMYWTRALHHHTVGLRHFNSQLKNLAAENSYYTFTFSLFLTIWVFGAAGMDKGPSGLDDILSLLDIVRGCKTVFDLHKDGILALPIGQAIGHPTEFHGCQNLPSAVCRALENLRSTAEDLAQISAVEGLWSSLLKTTVGHDARVGMGWPTNIEDKLWTRVRLHEPRALFIFAHYSLLLRRFDHRYWWMSGWSERLVRAVEPALFEFDRAFIATALDSIDALE